MQRERLNQGAMGLCDSGFPTFEQRVRIGEYICVNVIMMKVTKSQYRVYLSITMTLHGDNKPCNIVNSIKKKVFAT
jgi:hypothetical protein